MTTPDYNCQCDMPLFAYADWLQEQGCDVTEVDFEVCCIVDYSFVNKNYGVHSWYEEANFYFRGDGVGLGGAGVGHGYNYRQRGCSYYEDTGSGKCMGYLFN